MSQGKHGTLTIGSRTYDVKHWMIEGVKMTEAEWLACEDPAAMLEHTISLGLSLRKARLLAIAMCHACESELTDLGRECLALAVLAVENPESDMALIPVHNRKVHELVGLSLQHPQVLRGERDTRSSHAVSACFMQEVNMLACLGEALRNTVLLNVKTHAQCNLISEMIGNPFRKGVTHKDLAAHGILDWNGNTVPRMAQAIYKGCTFNELPVLADALIDAGLPETEECQRCGGHGWLGKISLVAASKTRPCDAGCQRGILPSSLLAHLRGPGQHVRGCWAVDLILGRN